MRIGCEIAEAERRKLKERAKTLFCPFERCRDHNKLDRNNIVFITKYGKDEHMNLCQCKTCKRKFSERRGIPLFGVRLPEDKFYQVIRCLVEVNGTRATGRIVECVLRMHLLMSLNELGTILMR